MYFKPKATVGSPSDNVGETPPELLTKIGIYPGTFDPITKGHIDLIERALLIVHDLVIAVVDDDSSNKSPIFSVKKRVEMIKQNLSHLDETRIRVESFNGLLVDFAREHHATRIVRGLRAVSDFEYEMQMAFMNKRLAPDIVTVFLPASEENQFISSRMVKEIAKMGGETKDFVSDNVAAELKKVYKKKTNK